jgi:hypothetical protein
VATTAVEVRGRGPPAPPAGTDVSGWVMAPLLLATVCSSVLRRLRCVARRTRLAPPRLAAHRQTHPPSSHGCGWGGRTPPLAAEGLDTRCPGSRKRGARVAGDTEGVVGASARETLYLRQDQTTAKVGAVAQEVGRLSTRLRLSRRELKPRMREVRCLSCGACHPQNTPLHHTVTCFKSIAELPGEGVIGFSTSP